MRITTKLHFALPGGGEQRFFSIDANTGVLRFVSMPNFEIPTDENTDNYYAVVISASDGRVATEQAVLVRVTNGNDAPTFTSAIAVSLAENVTVVGYSALATDEDGDGLSYSLTGGDDQSLFSIDANTGALSFISPADFENPADVAENNTYVVEISASDGADSTPKCITA